MSSSLTPAHQTPPSSGTVGGCTRVLDLPQVGLGPEGRTVDWVCPCEPPGAVRRTATPWGLQGPLSLRAAPGQWRRVHTTKASPCTLGAQPCMAPLASPSPRRGLFNLGCC